MRDFTLAEAAATNDALAEERGIEETVRDLGMSLLDLVHLAEQRALRAVLLRGGRAEELKLLTASMHPKGVALSEDEKAEMEALVPAYLDGITLGARWAQRNNELRP